MVDETFGNMKMKEPFFVNNLEALELLVGVLLHDCSECEIKDDNSVVAKDGNDGWDRTLTFSGDQVSMLFLMGFIILYIKYRHVMIYKYNGRRCEFVKRTLLWFLGVDSNNPEEWKL